jgi:hypothetical protein
MAPSRNAGKWPGVYPRRVLDRYAVIGIQTAFGSAGDADALGRNLDRVVELIEGALWAYSQWGATVRLVCLPEFCLQGIPYDSRDELDAHGVLLRSDGPPLRARPPHFPRR